MTTFVVKKNIIIVAIGISFVRTCVCCLSSYYCAPQKSLAPSSQYPLTVLRCALSLLCQALLLCSVLQPPDHFGGPLLNSLQYVNVFLVQKNQKLATVLQMQSHRCQMGERINSLGLLTTLLLKQHRMPLAFFAARTHCFMSN